MKQYETPEGLKLPRVMLGCMRIADMEYKELETLVHEALELGINQFDHADIYGKKRCEARFGEVLQNNPGLRERMFLQTKCGIRPGFYDSSYEHIVESVDNSLRNFSTDHLDCLLIHRPDVLADVDEMARAFEDLKKAGKVRYFGVSNHNPMQIELLQQAVGERLIFNQMQLSLMHTPMIDQGINVNTQFDGAIDRTGGVLEYCRLKKMVLQAWSPFQYGFIKGVFLDNPEFPEINEAMDQMAAKYSVSKTALAVAWLVRIPAMIQVIAGTTSKDRLKEIAQGADLELEREDWYALYRAAGNQLP